MAAALRSICSRIPLITRLHRSVPVVLSQGLKTSLCSRGLDEFFPLGVLDKGELAPEIVKSGRRWRAGELRIKSNEDLQKLWYVLLKERNMLNTLMHEAKRQGVPMPSPERYHKVKKSMAAIKLVLGEREIALKDLESQVWMFDKQADEEKNKELLSFALKSSNETTEQHSAPEAFVVNMNDDILKEQSKSPSEEEKPVLSPNLRPT